MSEAVRHIRGHWSPASAEIRRRRSRPRGSVRASEELAATKKATARAIRARRWAVSAADVAAQLAKGRHSRAGLRGRPAEPCRLHRLRAAGGATPPLSAMEEPVISRSTRRYGSPRSRDAHRVVLARPRTHSLTGSRRRLASDPRREWTRRGNHQRDRAHRLRAAPLPARSLAWTAPPSPTAACLSPPSRRAEI